MNRRNRSSTLTHNSSTSPINISSQSLPISNNTNNNQPPSSSSSLLVDVEINEPTPKKSLTKEEV